MKSNIRVLLILTILLSCFKLWGQGQAGVWYFGERAGLDFDVTPSAALTNGSLDTEEGCATVCTKDKDLLFYTDGITVYDKNHNVMTNGTGLNGHFSATQSSIIVQQPGSNTLYYIFTVDAHQNNLRNGLNYSIVDMSLNGGLGEVTVKNVVLDGNEMCEKITAVRHANGRDFWIVSHRWNSRNFYAYVFSNAGISAPVISTIGAIHDNTREAAIGYMKISPKGGRLALAVFTQDIVELFDFNNATGAVTNPVKLTGFTDPYGIEFSPSGNLLYVSSFILGEVYQFEVTGDQTTIQNSRVTVGNSPLLLGSLQLAPDRKIYIGKNNLFNSGEDYLATIENPEGFGLNCNYTENGKHLGGRQSKLGLPNFVTSLFSLEFTYQFDCAGDNTEFSITSDLSGITQAFWDFGDGNSTTTTTSPFGTTHTFLAAGEYQVKLIVNFSGGMQDSVTSTVTIQSLPTTNDQNPVLWEDSQGSGIVSGVDITQLEGAVNGGIGITYTWYSDAALTTPVPDPTNITVSNGTQFFVEVDDGVCSDVAQVTYSVRPLPEANDQNPGVCEDIFNTGVAGNVNLTLLEPAITGGSGLSVNWYHDVNTSQVVNQPDNRIVQNGEIFYAVVIDGVVSNTAQVTYTVWALPVGNDLTVEVTEDTYLGGTTSGINLIGYNLAVNPSGANVEWYTDAGFTIPVATPGAITVADKDIFYARIDDDVCINRGSIQFAVRAQPVANNLNLSICEDIFGSGQATGIDLTLLNDTITGGFNNPVTWFIDSSLTTVVPEPNNITVTNGDRYYAQVSYNGNTNTGIVTYQVRQLPVANDQNPTEYEDVFGSWIALGVDLTQQEPAILGGTNYAVAWFLDQGLTNPVPDPANTDVTNGDIFYAQVSDGYCTNVAAVQYTINRMPVALDIIKEVCEDNEGTGTASGMDLTQLENEINDGNGDTFVWYYNWPTQPLGLPVNAIPDPTNVTVNDGDSFYAVVSNAWNSNVATATYRVLALPVAIDQQAQEWENSFGLGNAYGVSLLRLNDAINGGTGNDVTWYQDSTLNTPVVTPGNIMVSTGDTFYALVSDGLCNNTAKATYTVINLPEANNLNIEACEESPGSLLMSNYDLTQLNNQVNNDPTTGKAWFSDSLLTQPVSTPQNVVVNDGDTFFVEVSFGGGNNIGRVNFSIQPLPVVQDSESEVCEDVYGSGVSSGEDITLHEPDITAEPAAIILWYADPGYQNVVNQPQNVIVTDRKIFYARIWNGSCSNEATLTYRIKNLAVANSASFQLCEDYEGGVLAQGINLNDYNEQVNHDSGVTMEWYGDDSYLAPLANPVNINIADGNQFFAKVIQNGCENFARVNFTLRSLPEANDFDFNLCENTPGSGQLSNQDLATLDSLSTNLPARIVEWYEDTLLTVPVNDIQQYEVHNNTVLFGLVSDGQCSNLSRINFLLQEQPFFELGADTTIFYTETKVLEPDIEPRFLPGNYLWQDGHTGATYTVNGEEGTYWLQFTDRNGCLATDTIRVDVERYRMKIPNAFTPDGDGVNDYFKPEIAGDISGVNIKMYIYNRWGELVFESADLGTGWDGIYKGKKAPVGVYVWVVFTDGKLAYEGHVSLLK